MTGGNKQSTTIAVTDAFWAKFSLSALAAVVAESVTYPLDLTKTRLQLQGEGVISTLPNGTSTVQYRGMFATASGIVQEEGILKLFQGLSPALMRTFVYTGSRMTIYEVLRENVLKREADGSFAVWKASLGGLTAGALGQLIASPTDLVKVQMQMEGKRRLEGKPVRVKNAFDAFANIVREGGFRGLYRGCVPNVQRAALVNMGDLCTYDTVKQNILRKTSLKDNYVTHTISSACSGLVSATLSTPADVIKTRIMNQPTKDGKGLMYKGVLDCFTKTVKAEGFMALYKGFVPIWSRMAPWSLTFWLTFEQIRKSVGAPSF